MQQMVATDAERVAITRDHPHHQVWPARLQAGSNGGRAAVNGMEAIRIHVIRETAGAANARDKDNFLPRHTQVGHDLLGLRQEGVIATPWTPAHFLVGNKIFAC